MLGAAILDFEGGGWWGSADQFTSQFYWSVPLFSNDNTDLPLEVFSNILKQWVPNLQECSPPQLVTVAS